MPVITISRGSLSGGERLAEHLHAMLGYELISREVLIEAAGKYGVEEATLAGGLEQPPGIWQRLTNEKERYILAVQATLAEMIQGGNAIYHGHAGQFLLQDLSPVIKLRLIAPIEYRVRAAIVEHGMTQNEAFAYIEATDRKRARWVRKIYAKDWANPAIYDLMFNLARVTIETAGELVNEIVGRAEFRHTPERDQELRDFALATRVRAALVFQSGFPENAVRLTARSGVVVLEGTSFFEKNRDRIARFVRAISGVVQVIPESDEPLVPSEVDVSGEKNASDVMLPISGYPHVREWNTLREAMLAIGTSSVTLKDGHLVPPRYVLVLDDKESVTGVVSRRDILRGLALTPEQKAMESTEEAFERLAPFVDLCQSLTPIWMSLFGPAAVRNSLEPVSSIMSPIKGTVRVDDNLSAAVNTMLRLGVDLVPVLDGDEIVGVVLMTEVFDIVAEFIAEGVGG